MESQWLPICFHYTKPTQDVLNVFYLGSLQCGICGQRVQLSSPVYSLITKQKTDGLQLKTERVFYFLFGWREEKVKDEFLFITHNHFHFNRIKVNFTDQFFPLWFGSSKGMVYRPSESIFLQMDNFIFNSNTSVSWKPNILPTLRGWRSAQEDRMP